MNLFKLYSKLLLEQNYGNRKVKTIIDAIKNRHPITFYYSGPQTPPKDRVLNGVRIRAEVVAYGLSKKGNEIIRAYIGPPSTTLRGYDKTHWRTFRIDRISSVRVLSDETYEKRNDGQYKEGNESTNGPMSKTYFTVKWDTTPELITKPKISTPPIVKKEVPPIEKPEPTPEPLPEPLSKEKPTISPTVDLGQEIFKKLQSNIKEKESGKYLSNVDFDTFSKELYKLKEKEWIDNQKVLNKNIKPGEGTRKKFEIDSKNELAQILRKNNINVVNNIDTINESLLKIKDLMYR